MSWEEDLFAVVDDLESQAQAAFAQERNLELEDRRRSEYAEVTLQARLMASVGSSVTLEIAGVGQLRGRLSQVADDWVLLDAGTGEWAVAGAAIVTVEGASRRAVPSVAWPVTARLGLSSALRRLAESGERCVLHRRDGGRHDGVLRRIGGDFCELHAGEPVRSILVSLDGLAAVQSHPGGPPAF